MIRRRDFLSTLPAPFLSTALQGSPKASSCILLLLVGGPSQIDTWDPKPDAPSGIRGPWKAIRTSVPGVHFTELFPQTARLSHKITTVRSVYHDGPALHEVGAQYLQSGAFSISDPAPHLGSSTRATTVLPGRLGNTGSGQVPNPQAGLNTMQPARFDFRGEGQQTIRRYGNDPFGQSCLMARRLVESGTRFVTVNMFPTVFDHPTWDGHGSRPFSTLAHHADHAAPLFDRTYSALIEDLADRGLLSSTLVVASGEFGRTPRINPTGGRDHWAACWTALLAGAGIPEGGTYGSSDDTASEPKDNPVHVAQLAATMAHRLGAPLHGDPAHSPLFT